MTRRCFRKVSLVMSLILLLLALSSVSAIAATGDITTMLPPSNLAVQMVTPDDAKLTWSSVFGATGYNIYGIIDGQLILQGSTTATYYNLKDLPEGSYRYVVSTLSGTDESGPCAPVTVDVAYPTMAAPETLTYTVQNGNDYVLRWTASQYAESYNVYEVKPDGQTTLVSTTTGLSYTLINQPVGSYKYVVTAANSLYGESVASVPVEYTVTFPTMTAPATFTATVTNITDVTLRWGAVTYATGYNIYQVNGTEKVLKGTVTGTAVSYLNLPGGDYTFEIHSYSDRFGESADSKLVSFNIAAVTMVAPEGLAYKIQNGNDIVLTWNPATYATNYKIYQIVDGQKVLKNTVTGTTGIYPNMPAGDYTYEIYAYNTDFGESATGSTISFTLNPVVMAAPANLTATVQNVNDIVLTWDAVTYANSYKVYQITNGVPTLKSTVTGTTAIYSKMPAGDYTYEIRSVSTRFGESPTGTQVTLTVGSLDIAPPANLTYTIKNGNDVYLTWDPVTDATSYKIYQDVNGVKVLRSNVTGTLGIYGNQPDGTYTYYVYSYSTRFGQSGECSTVTFNLVHPDMLAPQNLVQKVQTATQFTLSWDPSLYASGYRVYQIVNGQKVLKTTTPATSVTYSNMAPGTYTYEVHSYSLRFGESVEGTTLTFTLNGQVMAEPINPTYTITNGNTITLKWTAVPYANSYKIYQIIDGQPVLKSTVTTTAVSYVNMPEGNYQFELHSYSSLLGESPDGVQLSFDLVFPTMQAPATITAQVKNGNDVYLTWGAATYANSYKVYELVNGQEVLLTTVTTASAVLSKVAFGDHTYVVHSYSTRFGESPEGAQIAMNVSGVTLLPPANLTYTIANGNDIVLKWVAATYATSYNVYQIIDGAPVLQKTVTTTSATLANMPAGPYTFEVRSVSTRFGESGDPAQITLTLDPVTMLSPADLAYSITAGNDITLTWKGSLYANNYRVYQIIDGVKVLKSTVTTGYAKYVNMPEGNYTFEVYSYSTRFGESPVASTLTFDLVWPEVPAPSLSGVVFNANNLTLNWTAAAWANEYRLYEIIDGDRQLVYKGTARTFKIYNLSEETHYYEVTTYNTRFGESVPSNRLVEDIIYPIMQPPVATLTLVSNTSARISWDFVTYANGYNIYEIVYGQPVLLVKNVNNLSYTLSDLTYADHEYIVTSYSNSFGESDPSNKVLAKLIVDTEPPVTTASAPADWTNQGPVTVSLSATDNETGVAHTYYAINGGAFVEGTTVAVETEGITKVSFYSVDKVGNQEAVQTIEVKIDKAAPVTTASEVPAWAKEAVTVNLSATDALSGVAKTLYSIDGGAYMEGTTFTIDAEGIHKVIFYSVDAAGNQEAVQTIEVKIDKAAPVTTASEVPAWSKEAVAVNLSATDALSGVAKTLYSIDGGAYIEGTSFTIDAEGIHKVTFYSVDVAGNIEATQTIEVKIDKTASVLTLDLPAEYQLGASLPLNYLATDALSGVATSQMIVAGPDDPAGQVVANGTSFLFTKPGVYTITVTVTDAAGWTTTLQKQVVVYIPATIQVTPMVIKGNNGIFTVRVDLPQGLSTQGFDLNTATLNGVNALTSNNGYYNQAKLGQFKFERSQFTWTPGEMTVTFRGMVDGYLVVGQTTVKVQK